jgi:hypothetical protein
MLPRQQLNPALSVRPRGTPAGWFGKQDFGAFRQAVFPDIHKARSRGNHGSEASASDRPRPARLNTPHTIGMFKLLAEQIATHLDGAWSFAVSEARLASGCTSPLKSRAHGRTLQATSSAEETRFTFRMPS